MVRLFALQACFADFSFSLLSQHRAGGGEKKIFDDKKYLRQSQADGGLSR